VPAAWHELARIEFLRGNFAAALTAINTQIKLHGHDTVASYYVRALIEGFMQQNDAAEADFKVFLAAKPGNWGVYNDLAWIYFQEGAYGKAEAIAREGLKIAPESPWLLTSLGVALFNEGENVEAREVLTRARTKLDTLSAGDWSRVNPGNDPQIARSSLGKMKEAVEKDLALIPVAR
jgi:tetratricopeptide (TPR) repeat protein